MPVPAIFDAERFVLINARLPDSVAGKRGSGAVSTVNLTINDGKITSIVPGGSPVEAGTALHDMDGGLILPAFVDAHTHLDKGHIWPRKPNPDGTFMSALEAVAADREARWSADDVRARMDFSLRCAFANGTAAIRTHLDSAPPQDAITWPLFEEMRARWAGRIELQAVALLGPDHLLDRRALDDVAKRVKAAGGVLGGAIASHPEMRRAMRNLVEAAGEHGLAIDCHCDETADPQSTALSELADAVIETGFGDGVVAGHCCALALKDEATARDEIARVLQAGIAIISLPMCNLYLQDRSMAGRTPRWRGVAPLAELAAAGVPVAIASDNTRDPFYAYGDLDALEVLREGARIIHFDHPEADAWRWAPMVGAAPAAFTGMRYQAEIAVGAPADMVLFSARSFGELMARPQSDRIVLRRGRAIDTTPPDYRELDHLMGDAE